MEGHGWIALNQSIASSTGRPDLLASVCTVIQLDSAPAELAAQRGDYPLNPESRREEHN